MLKALDGALALTKCKNGKALELSLRTKFDWLVTRTGMNTL